MSELVSSVKNQPRVPLWARALAAGSLSVAVLSGCGASGGEKPAAQFVFDSYGSDISKGGSNVIYVYGDPSEGGRGTESGTFMSGQEAPADCYVEGRTVSRHPEQGETAGSSSTWYHLEGGEYATGAYGAPAASVPHC